MDAAIHLAGTYAAKEAVGKAFEGKYHLSEIEIVRKNNGAPEAYRKKKRLYVSISITHEKGLAMAAAAR